MDQGPPFFQTLHRWVAGESHCTQTLTAAGSISNRSAATRKKGGSIRRSCSAHVQLRQHVAANHAIYVNEQPPHILCGCCREKKEWRSAVFPRPTTTLCGLEMCIETIHKSERGAKVYKEKSVGHLSQVAKGGREVVAAWEATQLHRQEHCN
jgi:hypothetical protein